jgi:HSP20 family protein
MQKGDWLDGLFCGLGNLLRIATDVADGADRAERTRDAAAVYGVSVRVRTPVAPPVRAGAVRTVARKEPVADPIADAFDERDHYLIVAELPGVQAPAVEWHVANDVRLIIRAQSGDRRYYKEIVLNEPVDMSTAVCSCENGVLELRLWKQLR